MLKIKNLGIGYNFEFEEKLSKYLDKEGIEKDKLDGINLNK
jgi:hypothetical protein